MYVPEILFGNKGPKNTQLLSYFCWMWNKNLSATQNQYLDFSVTAVTNEPLHQHVIFSTDVDFKHTYTFYMLRVTV